MSLRTRLTISYIGFFAIALIVLHSGLYLVVRGALMRGIDNELQVGAQSLQRSFENSNQTVVTFFDGNEWRTALRGPQIQNFEMTNLHVQVYSNDARVLNRSSDFDLPITEQALSRALDGESSAQIVDVGPGRLRQSVTPLFFVNPVTGEQQVVGVLQIARTMDETDRALTLLFYALVGGGVIVLLAAARGGMWLTRASFRPIDEIAYTAQNIVRAEDLSRRVPVPEAQDELQRLTVIINEMLARMDALFSVQRRLVADVSHELRTPLAAMRGNLEILERGAARDPEMLSESLSDMRREVNRLIRMVNDLLLLAQSDAGFTLRREPVELDTLLLEVLRELRPLANGVQLRLGHEDQVVVDGDGDRIKQALLNLGVNALQHTLPGGSVTLSLEQADGYACLSVTDTGSGIPVDQLPLIFERFYRADRSRQNNGSGAGLGLAIVKWIAEAHNGRVRVKSTVGAGSTFSLFLPLERAPINHPPLQNVHADQPVLSSTDETRARI